MFDTDSEDLFLGKKALDRRMITPAQLREAMIEQARGPLPEGQAPPRLGDVLIARRILTREQLDGLQEETARIVRGTVEPRDATLGRILVENRTITNSQLLECLREQDQALRSGQTVEPRLGELLVQRGYATGDEIRQALAVQEKTILGCTGCGRRCNAAAYDPSRRYACPSCKADLRPAGEAAEVSVQDRTQEVPLPAPTGRVLGKYAIVREVGQGGMGIVYEAIDTTLNRRVALKMLGGQGRPDSPAARMGEERFLREAKLCAQLPTHPHIVGIYEAGVLDGSRYIAMEFIDGVPMLGWWKDKSIRLRQHVAVLRDTALGVHHAHAHGVVHRDLKPENILIDSMGQPHITDFGLARELQQSPKDALTGKGMVVGSPHYMSPEAVRGLRVDRRADVYSLGVMLYEVFTGKRPFDGGTPEEIMMKALKAEVPSPSSVMRSQINPVLHRSLEHVCLKAIARDPKERYPTAKALAEDLTRWLGGEEVAADLPDRRRRRRLAGALGVAVAGALLGTLGYAYVSRPSVERELANAAELTARGDLASARSAYDRVLARNPAHKDALEGKQEVRRRLVAQRLAEAQAMLDQGRASEAFDAFMLILIEDPHETRARDGKEEAKRRMVLSGRADGPAVPRRP